MFDDIEQLSEFTLHVVLATFPQTQEKEFDESVKKDFYKEYLRKSKEYLRDEDASYGYYGEDRTTPIIYNPISYHILGNYDIAYITLIDNFKFAQRLFEPQLTDDAECESGKKNDTNANADHFELFAPHTFQSFTGITHHDSSLLKKFFYEHKKPESRAKKYFLGICNLKLNNGFLLGNGRAYLDAVIKRINQQISSYAGEGETPLVEHLILQSFSWFEISLLLFTDNPQKIADIMQELRRFTIEDLGDIDNKITTNSLYKSLFKNEKIVFDQANVFADTHTYIGVHCDIFDQENDEYFKQLLNEDFDLRAEVEWQIKPGHLHLLTEELAKNEGTKNFVVPDIEKIFLAGRSDYTLKSNKTTLKDVVKLIRSIMSKNHELFNHVRKIKSKIYFNGIPNIEHKKKKVINLHEKLKVLAEDMDDVADVNRKLKALKISRQIRLKVLKIFSNYNNGIQDIILFPYLLDFKIFMEVMKRQINSYYVDFLKRFEQPNDCIGDASDDKLEDVLMEMITIFQEGFNIRMLNPYQFEDINDFDLDFNSSIQQLLSVFSMTAFEIGNLIYGPDYSYGPVIQLNLKDTVSNVGSINYYVHHLTSPEFVFATLTKEIINSIPNDDMTVDDIVAMYESQKAELLDVDLILRDLDDRSLINLQYYLNDTFRFVWSYNLNFDLFYFWFWTYNFQNASLYSEMGLMSEAHFEKELFRILFIAKFFYNDKDLPKLYCPLPELETYWERHYDRLALGARSFVVFLDAKKVTVKFVNYLQLSFELLMQRSEKDCGSINEDGEAAGTFLKSMRARQSNYDTDNRGGDFKKLIARRCHVFSNPEKLAKGVTVKSTMYLEWYMWSYLNLIYRLNDKQISLVRRNWKDGRPMVSFLHNNDKSHLYSIDQTGGLFFDDMKQQNRYFKYTSKVLLDLWNYSMISKRNFINVISKRRHDKKSTT